MKIAVLGAGNIGGTLGVKWAQAGHEVVFGVRDPSGEKVQARLAEAGSMASAGTLTGAIAASEVVLFATPYSAVEPIANENAAALDKKILIDATNNFGASVINNIAALERHAPTARIYRAFNALGWENFADPNYGETAVDLFYCGPGEDSKSQVAALIEQLGLRPVYVGGLDMAPVVDALGALWVTLAFRQGWGRSITLKLLQR